MSRARIMDDPVNVKAVQNRIEDHLTRMSTLMRLLGVTEYVIEQVNWHVADALYGLVGVTSDRPVVVNGHGPATVRS